LKEYTDLGNEFIDEGFDTFFGYKVSVNTIRNAYFYEEFFNMARFTNVAVAEAASYAKDEAEDQFTDASDVSQYRFIGNSNLCLHT
jgi:hypothetical protein